MMEIKLEGIDKVLAVLHPRIYTKALNKTVNDIGSKIKTQSVRDVRKTYNISAKELKSYMKIRRSRYSRMSYSMEVESNRRNAIHFSSRIMKKKGYASVRIKKTKGRSTLRNTFKSKDGKALLHRVGKTQKIEAVQTISVPQMFNEKILKEANDMASNEFGKKLQDNFKFYIGDI